MPDAVTDTARHFLHSFIKPCRILVAVSGGSDSKGLLVALHAALESSEYEGFSLAACTVDHALRPESTSEAEAVAVFCAQLGIPHCIQRWTGDKPPTGIQAAARNKRYELLAEAARALRAECIVTGHTLDDQRETIAMRGARSAGKDGVRGARSAGKDGVRGARSAGEDGMRGARSAGEDGMGDRQGDAGMAATMLYGRQVWVLRPFLGLGRVKIRAYLDARGIGWMEDPSNANPLFERARVRADLAASPDVPVPPRRGAQRAASSARAAALIEEHVRVHERLVAEISASQAGKMEDPDWRRALMCVAAVLGGRDHLPAEATVRRLSGFLQSGEPGRMTAGRVVFDRRRGGLYLCREPRGLPVLTLDPGGQGIWDGRFTITSKGPSLTVSAGEELSRQRLIDAGLPKGVAGRAAQVAPCVVPAEADYPRAAAATVDFRIGLYDTFLPGFDRIMADAIAVLFGRDRYPVPPVHDVLTEMEE